MSVLSPSSARPGGLASPPAQRPRRAQPHGGRPLAAFFLAAAVAALAVAAGRLMDSWSDQHLLATWLALWAVVFAGSLLLAGTARRTAQHLIARLDQWARVRADARAEARALLLARHDPRLMAELQAARGRAEVMCDMATSQTLPSQSVAATDTTVRAADEWAWSGTEVIELGGTRRVLPWYV